MKHLFYENISGKLFTDWQTKQAFSIVHGISWKDNESEYLCFLWELLSTKKIKFIADITVDELLKRGEIIYACELYSEIHGCSIVDAKNKILNIPRGE